MALAGCFLQQAPAQSLENDEASPFRPGMLAELRSVASPNAVLQRVDAKPAFFLGEFSPHPRLPAGPFTATWSGMIHVADSGPISFSAFVGGEAKIIIDGVTVLDASNEDITRIVPGKAALTRDPGHYAIEIRFRSTAKVPARLQVHWEGPTFAREPIPAWRFRHRPEKVESEWQIAERGIQHAEHFGCARCHASSLPAAGTSEPGPDLSDVGKRLSRDWILRWLADPEKLKHGAAMPALFSADQNGNVERWLIANHLSPNERQRTSAAGDHRAGRLAFMSLGCPTCHFVPEMDRAEQTDFGRKLFIGLADRFQLSDLAEFLQKPHVRYPDGRMPSLRVTESEARNIAAYLLLWSKPIAAPKHPMPDEGEVAVVLKRLEASDSANAAKKLIFQKNCAACHTGLEKSTTQDIPIQKRDAGCLAGKTLPRFSFAASQNNDLAVYLQFATADKFASPVYERQRRLNRAGCVRCHQRDTDLPPPIEAIGSSLGGAFLQFVPFQRTPRLTYPHQKYTRAHLQSAIADGITTLRSSRYTYRMPAYGNHAQELVRALAESDGEIPDATDVRDAGVADPTVGTLEGPQLVGSQGFSCVSCHVWNGQLLTASDPGAIGPDLTRVAGRIRRDWFEQFLDNPLRYHPGTPMPTVFERNKPSLLRSVLAGDAAKQKEALWSYFAQGKTAPSPKAPPPVPVESPSPGEPVIVAQIPLHLPDGKVIESISLLNDRHDLLVYDLAQFAPIRHFPGAQILRSVSARTRQFSVGHRDSGIEIPGALDVYLNRNGKSELMKNKELIGHDRLTDGVTFRRSIGDRDLSLEVEETLKIGDVNGKRHLSRQLRIRSIQAGATLLIYVDRNVSVIKAPHLELMPDSQPRKSVKLTPDANGMGVIHLSYDLAAAKLPEPFIAKTVVDEGPKEGSLERPGYRARAYPRPKTPSGEDRVMPGAVAVDPSNGNLYVASLKTGELFVVRKPNEVSQARFENYARGLFQDALSMVAENDGLYVLHRRNLSKLVDRDRDGFAERVERVLALPHGIGETYDYAYGLVHDRNGFVLSYAPYANATMKGSGSAIRWMPGKQPEEIAFGMRNPVGWAAGPNGDIFFTDNQGEWVPANKLCHAADGRYHGFPNRSQPEHTKKSPGKPSILVPYSWARSINGVTYDTTNGKFGPFAGQFFMAELMYGGAIIRADVEKVNGVYQGACFPFWGKGLLGPVTLAFDPNGPLYVGGITEPGWMSMPDRGALFRIDYIGETPFEMQNIRVTPKGFRITFTLPIEAATAAVAQSYHVEHYRYEYTGAYGSPELDRTRVKVHSARVSTDGKSVELTTDPLMTDRVYRISAAGIRSKSGNLLVHNTGAYTLNEVPKE